ncbi:MAG TPA: replicative DNA helicase [Vicinamibacteria bacterium]|nr:replicative DNA helicase [Vicinamibacteria bacterium]
MATELVLKEKSLPHNAEAEKTVLGAILVDNQAFNSAAEILNRNDFYRDSHRRIFDAMAVLSEKSQPIDLVTLKDELVRAQALEVVGGAAYLGGLLDGVPRITNVEHWARIIKEKSVLRSLIHAGTRIVQSAYEAEEDAALLLDQAEKQIFDIAEHRVRQGFVGIREIVKESFRTIDQLSQSKELVTGLPTGFVDIDERTSGLQKGDLIIVAARPAMGKTSFVLNVAQYASIKTGETVGIFSLEMSKEQLVIRMLCADARVDSHRLRTGNLQEKDWARLAKAYADLSAARIFIDDSATITPLEIRAKCRRLKAEHGLGLVVVDYLQLVTGSGKVENRQQEISQISRSMKGLAKELSVPVIALSQLSRAPEARTEKRPQLSDLRECVTGDTLVQLADGRRVAISELVGTIPEVVAVDERGFLTRATAEAVWKVGRRETLSIRLASGRRIRCTARHRLFGLAGWVRVSDLAAGSRIAMARRVPEPEQTVAWPDEVVALLGQLIGDGSYLAAQPLRFTTESEANSEVVARGAQLLGSTVKRYAGRRGWHQLLISGNGNRWHPAGVNAWLRELGIHGQRSYEKRLPAEAFRLSDPQVGLLLRHLWATDGTIWAGRTSPPRASFATTSFGLAADVAALLLRLGVQTRRYVVRQPGYRPLSHVSVSGHADLVRFCERVGAHGPRRPQLDLLLARLATSSSNTNVDTVPKEVFDRVRGLMVERGITTRAMAARRGTSYGGTAHFRFAPSRAVLADYAAILEDQVLSERSHDDLFWDRIVSIEAAGEADVFDLTVPGPHSWLADGIVSHNSGGLEQDADVVAFIFREEEYKPTDENRGVAEIIIGKQRNGPTGTVRLAFIREFTRFENLEWRAGG